MGHSVAVAGPTAVQYPFKFNEHNNLTKDKSPVDTTTDTEYLTHVV